MVYVGTQLASVRQDGVEPALINPSRPIASAAADCHLRYTNYWPSYDTISPEARASYLQWLAAGKCDPAADLGYVFLYFYGLERRALWDTFQDPQAKAEIPAIEQELKRLLGIYGNNGSFYCYANSFLNYLCAGTFGTLTLDDLPVPEAKRGWALSLELRVGLGLHARAGRSLPAIWANIWYLCDPNQRHRQVVDRCGDTFNSLFKIEYEKQFGKGLKLPVNKTRIKVGHRAASMSFAGQRLAEELDLPDVSILSEPVKKLQEIGEACSSSLAAYSRFLGSNPDKTESLEALLLLPTCIWPEVFRNAFRELRRSVEGASRTKLMSFGNLISLLPKGGDLNKARVGALNLALGSFGLGIEPDVRFGGSLPAHEDTVALFIAEGLDCDHAPSDGFQSAALMLQMASAVAAADASFDETEAAVMLDYINTGLNLPALERDRLSARVSLYRASPPNSAGLKKRIEKLDKTGREAISDFLLQIALADSVIDPGEVRVLENMFTLLGLDRSTLYSKLHGGEAQPISPAVLADGIHRVPPSRASGPSVIQFDPARIAALKADSAKVSALLGNVFVDEAPIESEHAPIEALEEDMDAPLLNLDTEHAGLLQVLLQRVQWNRAELEEVCSDRGLMLDGAIERINEAAFLRFDTALIEGEDPLDINCDLMLEEMA